MKLILLLFTLSLFSCAIEKKNNVDDSKEKKVISIEENNSIPVSYTHLRAHETS